MEADDNDDKRVKSLANLTAQSMILFFFFFPFTLSAQRVIFTPHCENQIEISAVLASPWEKTTLGYTQQEKVHSLRELLLNKMAAYENIYVPINSFVSGLCTYGCCCACFDSSSISCEGFYFDYLVIIGCHSQSWRLIDWVNI